MITAYEVSSNYTDIRKIQFSGETKCFYIEESGRKTKKDTDWYKYFQTFDDAKTHLTIRTTAQINHLKLKLESKIEEFEKLRLLKEYE